MAHPNRSHPDPISSHVLDTKSGLPAKGVTATLFVKKDIRDESSWQTVSTRVTNDDGRASAFLTWDQFLCAHYKMRFEVGEYFASHGVETFFPYAEIVFDISDPGRHYHIPLLLSPYGYTTYRGS